MSKEEKIEMGVSQWKNHGLKYRFWNFFETEIRKDWQDELAQAKQDTLAEVREIVGKMTESCPWIEEFKSEDEFLWVKIKPDPTGDKYGKSYRILPEKALSDLLSELK